MSTQLTLWPQQRPLERIRWSVSRDKRLRDCPRKYYLYHYGSVGGRKADATEEIRQIYMLKHLRNRHMWVGELVHELIELTLNAWRRGEEVKVEGLVARGTRRMRAHYVESLQGVYRERPSQACGLVEHEYGEAIHKDEWQGLRDRMERCLRNFFQMPIVEEIRRTPTWRWLALEAMSSFSLDGATILVKPDFAWREDDGQVVMADWKTGLPRDGESDQLAVYGMYAQRVWGLGEAPMRAYLVYLNSAELATFDMGAQRMDAAEAEVRASVRRMRSLAGNTGAAPTLDNFPRTDALQVCGRCAFRRVCGRA